MFSLQLYIKYYFKNVISNKKKYNILTSSVSTFKINIELAQKTSDEKQILKKQINHFFSHLQKHVTVSSTSRKIYPLAEY